MGICSQATFLKIMYLIKVIINIIRIVVPIILIVSSMIEFTRAISSNDSDSLNKSLSNVVKKFIAAILLFLIPTFIYILCGITDRLDIYDCIWNVTKQDIRAAEERVNNNSQSQNNTIDNGNVINNAVVHKKLNNTGEFQKTFTGSNGKTIKYWVLVPENATEDLPVIMYFHGRGGNSSYNTLNNIEMAHEVKKQYGNNYPFIVLLPYKNTESWYEMGGGFKIFSDLIDSVSNEYKTNKSKIILTGCSDGGLGVWQMGVDYPNKFSAFVPVSGWGHTYSQQKLENLKGKYIRGIVSSDTYDGNFKYRMEQACTKLNNLTGSNKCTLEVRQGLTHGTIVSGDTVNGTFVEGAYTKEVFEWMISK